MVDSILALDQPGRIAIMTGNQAIARGAVEAGVKVAAAYPGTPSTEILESLASVAPKFGIHAEWSTNEMVAMEVAAGAAIMGVRSMVSFKHVGLNWAADPFMVINQTGVEGGLLIVTADDPSGHSSQNEQDNRNYGMFAEILTLEPSSVSEAKEMAMKAFDLSEELKLPVLLRSVTRLAHARGTVVLGDLKKQSRKPYFSDNVERWICRGIYTEAHHKTLHAKNGLMNGMVETLPFNQLSEPRDSLDIGIITSGIGYVYAKEALKLLRLNNVALLKIGTPYPVPKELTKKFLRSHRKVLVVEEGSPLVETQTRVIAYELNEHPDIHGRLTEKIPWVGEITADLVATGIAKILSIDYRAESAELIKTKLEAEKILPRRPLALCSGCPHRATLYALRQALKETDRQDKAKIAGDIGCYGSGAASLPFNILDTLLCMGGGIGLANGFSQAKWDGPIIALIGDSTFVHAGIPPLINAVYNGAKFVLLVMDNRTTAMTGMQPHPGTGVTAIGTKTAGVKIEDIVRAVGVDFVEIVDPHNIKETVDSLKRAILHDKVAVVIARRPCMLQGMRGMRKRGVVMRPFMVDKSECDGCRTCLTDLACPAFRWDKKERIASINAADCTSCGFCSFVCPSGAIKLRK